MGNRTGAGGTYDDDEKVLDDKVIDDKCVLVTGHPEAVSHQLHQTTERPQEFEPPRRSSPSIPVHSLLATDPPKVEMPDRGESEQDRSDQAESEGRGVVVDRDPCFAIGDGIFGVERTAIVAVRHYYYYRRSLIMRCGCVVVYLIRLGGGCGSCCLP